MRKKRRDLFEMMQNQLPESSGLYYNSWKELKGDEYYGY